MSPLRSRLGPYLPALTAIATAIVVGLVFHRPIANWFAGRPVLSGEPSRPITVDAGPHRVGASVRPATPHVGENALFLGVGDRAGNLLAESQVIATLADGTVLPVEAGGEGQFRVDVDLPETPLPVHLVVRAPGQPEGHAVLVLEAHRPGLALEGQQEGVAFFTCPMHPSVRAPAPQTCPICGMDLVPVTHEEIASGAVRLDARRRQLIGVTTEVVDKKPFRVTVRASGIATWDETRLIDVSARADGWVESIFADFTGKDVQKGEPLLSLYVPEIRAAELELIAAARGHRLAEGTPLAEGAGALQSAARDKLRALGVGDDELRHVLRNGKPEAAVLVRAPEAGVVAEKMVKRGSPVMANQPMMRLGALDPIWVEVHVYEQDARLIRPGLEAQVSFPYLPGAARRGTVTFLEPTLDAETRTMRVRIALSNADDPDHPEARIRPGMYADARFAQTLPDRLIVPESAVIYAGPRRIVFIDEGAGEMRPVEVEVGLRGDDGYEVTSGLAPGQRVVTSGNFLLGAESRLRSALGSW